MTYKPKVIAFTMTAIALASGPVTAQDPYARADDAWISISGTVASPTASTFTLDYGDGVITVEMDDWDSYGDAYGLLDGDDVTVYGRIDDDFYEARTIEASSVYVDSLNTYFYASAADEEGGVEWTHPWTVVEPVVSGQTVMRGTVTAVSPADQEFTLSVGGTETTVQTDELTYNPLDDTGYQKVDVGDRVSVVGYTDGDFIQGRMFNAETVITLDDNSDQG